MNLDGARIILTGASGGIGAALARSLAGDGARLALLGRHPEALRALGEEIGGEAHVVAVDLLATTRLGDAARHAARALGGIDVLVNNAGQQSFRPFAEEDPGVLERVVDVNLVAPMLLTRAVLPLMLAGGGGRIVNVGSTFGSIGFAWFAAYSASKFGLRGFSEALRRELEGTGVGVTYVAPRAVRTRLNPDALYRMADETRMSVDTPQWVAQRVKEAIEQDRKDVFLGSPESFFARLNALAPRLVDAGLRKQNRRMEPYARRA